VNVEVIAVLFTKLVRDADAPLLELRPRAGELDQDP